MIHRQQAGRQMLGIGVDGVTEQEKLHHRQRDDHAQRQRVAPDLDPFLAQYGEEAPERETVHSAAVPGWLSRWMNTSSNRGGIARQTSAPPSDRVAVSSAARSMPAMCSADPNTAADSTPGIARSTRAARSRPG